MLTCLECFLSCILCIVIAHDNLSLVCLHANIYSLIQSRAIVDADRNACICILHRNQRMGGKKVDLTVAMLVDELNDKQHHYNSS